MAEAAVKYEVGRQEDAMSSTISSKNQITLPAQLLREMGLHAGDRVAITREGNRLMLRGRPKDWVGYYAGSLAGAYGQNAREVNAYVKDLRAEGKRAEVIERAWSGPATSPEP